jgi:hypothetical protein
MAQRAGDTAGALAHFDRVAGGTDRRARAVAEARIAYGGRGQLTDVQAPRWGQQVLDIVLPF